MPFIPAPNVAKVVIVQNLQGNEVINQLHFQKPTAISGGDLNTLATAVATLWIAQIMPLCGNTLYINYVQAVDLTTQSSPSYIHAVTPPVAGSLTSPTLPANVAINITKRTALRGRAYRGRTYLAGSTQADITDPGHIGLSKVSSLLSGLLTVLTDSSISPFVWGVLSYFLNKSARSVAAFTPGQSLTGDTLWDSQRRRLYGRGA